ncbi:MAG TPA: cytochrome c [Steroidobacteraceae bacterium]|jgi:mono/diheme cytochrome c family protein|nr:cytochrome c [Steroidobacteraceae bacterium]
MTVQAAILIVLVAMTSVDSCTLPPAGVAQQRGRQTFERVCATCHGADARGNGPVAEMFAVPVPDLTRIAARRGGAFPKDEIFRIIDGQTDMAAHGTRRMPVWGYEFSGARPDNRKAHDEAVRKIEDLVEYLGSIQQAD